LVTEITSATPGPAIANKNAAISVRMCDPALALGDYYIASRDKTAHFLAERRSLAGLLPEKYYGQQLSGRPFRVNLRHWTASWLIPLIR
jgi:hypothetical protein